MPPSSWYVDQQFLDLERERVFGATWQPVARVAQLREPGDHVAGQVAGMPYVVTRDDGGELRAFHNVCRHKGREVVIGCGRAEALVCGYHAWRYDLRGRLASAPRMAGVQNFDRGQMSLPPLAVEAWGPWVFVHFSLRGAPTSSLADSLSELTRRLDASEWGALEYVYSAVWDIQCNWKVYADNYLDGGYHIPHMHPSLDGQLDMETYRTELFDTYSIQSSGAALVADETHGVDGTARIGQGAIYAWLFPNFMLNRYGPCLDTNLVVPMGPDRCQVHCDFFFAPGGSGDDVAAQRAFIDESIEQSAIIQREDVEICESVQRGLGSPSYDRGRYAPRVEQGEYHFHQLLKRAYLG